MSRIIEIWVEPLPAEIRRSEPSSKAGGQGSPCCGSLTSAAGPETVVNWTRMALLHRNQDFIAMASPFKGCVRRGPNLWSPVEIALRSPWWHWASRQEGTSFCIVRADRSLLLRAGRLFIIRL
jgi:hypothetical protein